MHSGQPQGGKERHAAAAGRLWEKKGSPSLSPCIYTSHKLRWGVWGWVRGVLSVFWSV